MTRRDLAYTALILVGCATGPKEYVDAGPALDQVKSVIRDFAIANEFHYADEATYTADLDLLQSAAAWAYADSVELSVSALSADGWAVVGTHVRLGSAVGCAMAWGRRPPPISTPSGVLFGGGNQILCDEVISSDVD